ncbi:fimbrial protein [Aeromonas sp. CA23]|uniref:fimbrial protein n=1 Tax=Aeromonas sp. CA23 TaxID=2033032 RepID=UPI000BFE34FF|nr:fimbrial protein [Aeromonas sp. CA23]ATM00993.1 fimbrial protein [Aeromonas sp. CA23]
MSINRTNFLASVIVLVASSGVSANCFRIDGSTNPAPSSNTYLEPGMGNRVAWTGSTDSTGYVSGVSVPNTINLNSSAFQPDGTILASGIQTIYAATGNILDPESVLFRCQPGDENSLYEYFSTNGDDARRGMIEIGTAAGLGEGIYRTEAQDIGLRITNLTTMQTLSRYYKGRQLTGLDKDSQGWTLVKAKNFSTQFKVDYIKVAGSIGHTGDFHYYIAPSGYLTFVGPGIPSNYTEGSDAAAKYLGHFAYWPASLANGWGIKVRRAATCAVTNVTPTVTFPPISVEELESGGVRQVPIDIRFDCQTGAPASTGLIKFVSGTSLNQTAMGILVQPANAAAAQAEGLATGGGCNICFPMVMV